MSEETNHDPAMVIYPGGSDVLDSVPSRVQEMKIIVEALKETHRHIEALLQAGFTTTAEKTQQRADTLVNALMGSRESK